MVSENGNLGTFYFLYQENKWLCGYCANRTTTFTILSLENLLHQMMSHLFFSISIHQETDKLSPLFKLVICIHDAFKINA